MFKFFIITALLTAKLTAKEMHQELLYHSREESLPNGYNFEMADFLGLSEELSQIQQLPSLRNSAAKFLLEVYEEVTEEEQEVPVNVRHKRALRDDTFITPLDRLEIEQSNNIITFSSKAPLEQHRNQTNELADLLLQFNTKDVSQDLELLHAALRLYQQPDLGQLVQHESNSSAPLKVTVSIYQRYYNRQQQIHEFRIWSSLNTTTHYKGWLEFNVTRLLGKWLRRRATQDNVVRVGVAVQLNSSSTQLTETSASKIGIVATAADMFDLQPFMVGYFNGPELMAKIQKLRFKRDVIRRKRSADYYQRPAAPPTRPENDHTPRSCERLNFTVDFRELQMDNWVIAPKKFEAYFCRGECNFPLSAHMNATHHAIVQTMMRLKHPNLPKACCVPTVLGSISILHHLNEDNMNLNNYPQSVAKECGCH